MTRPDAPTPPRRLSGQTWFLAGAIALALAAVGAMVALSFRAGENQASAAAPRLTLEKIPFDGARAYEALKQISDIGPRPSGSPGMAAQQKRLIEHFEKLGGKVEQQSFTIKHPLNGSEVPIVNLIVRWQPEKKERILLCAHYDTRPFPDMDPTNPKGTFIGANDGASGVAVLMELGREMADRESRFGVDFVFFDAEEFVFGRPEQEQGKYFVGAEHFARTYATGKPGYRYRWGVLLDMVGGANLQVYQEANSMSWPETRPLVRQIWTTAARLGVSEFIPRTKYEIRDDHLPLRNLGRIPTCDIISYDYPPWHTQGDTPDKCSALSLAKVGWVMSEWLKSLK